MNNTIESAKRKHTDLQMMRDYRVQQISRAKEWIAIKNKEINDIDRQLMITEKKLGRQFQTKLQ